MLTRCITSVVGVTNRSTGDGGFRCGKLLIFAGLILKYDPRTTGTLFIWCHGRIESIDFQILVATIFLTFGADVELCSEA